MDPWNRRAINPEINSYSYGQLIFNKEGKNIEWEKDGFFSKWYWEILTVEYKSMTLEYTLTPPCSSE